ncbi:MAG: hypothetical protein ACK4GT_19730 [Pararhodobacter sp.]
MIIERLGFSQEMVTTLEALRAHLRTSGDDYFDAEIAQMAEAAANEAESFGELALLSQRIRVSLDRWWGGQTFPLPIIPAFDPASVSITADGAPVLGFTVLTGLRPAIRLAELLPDGPVVIEYLAGWPDSAVVPVDLRLAIMDQALAYFDARGPEETKLSARSPQFARIVARYRRVRI